MEITYIPEFGKYSAYASELISLKHKIRRIVQISIYSQDEFSSLKKFAKRYDWIVLKSQFKFDAKELERGRVEKIEVADKRKGLFHVFIFDPKGLVFTQIGDKELGELMSYPSCCIKSYMRHIYSNNIFKCINIEGDFHFNHLINPFIKYVSNAHIINHLPCSLNCKKSFKLAKAICKIMIENYPSFYEKIYNYSHYPILIFSKSESDSAFKEKPDIVIFRGHFNKKRIVYNNIFTTNNNLYKLFKFGNNVSISKRHVRVFYDNKLIYHINREEKASAFLFPY